VQLEFIAGRVDDGIPQSVQHTITGAVSDDKIIGKGCNVLDIKQEKIFALFLLQCID
jgi:hypothetical protein